MEESKKRIKCCARNSPPHDPHSGVALVRGSARTHAPVPYTPRSAVAALPPSDMPPLPLPLLTTLLSAALAGDMSYYNVGVLMASRLDSPFDLERCGPAIDLALEEINEKFLSHHDVRLQKVQER